MDRKIAKWPGRALGSLLVRTALLARPYVTEGSVSLVASAVVQLLAEVPDLRAQHIQKLTDGEMFYIIIRGVRLTEGCYAIVRECGKIEFL